ncbi:hypothetical protein MYX76_06110 [Desulfobacterota bacterium AH_259_B03_O07]|nr:hypothetical protein [Desulfobacterota bacterium AH_259_B03_O07]
MLKRLAALTIGSSHRWRLVGPPDSGVPGSLGKSMLCLDRTDGRTNLESGTNNGGWSVN